VTINEREILAEPEIPEQVKTLLKHLASGHYLENKPSQATAGT
jgi:hypothetical protein